jgi:hypothetical protein
MGGEKCQRVLCAGTVADYLADPGHARSLTESGILDHHPTPRARAWHALGPLFWHPGACLRKTARSAPI